MPEPTYDLLIPTIPHRHAKLCALLEHLGGQMVPGAGVRVFRDNLEHGLREKNQALLDSSAAEYVSWLDDDDWVADDYLPKVMAALVSRPDYVGFGVRWTVDGARQVPVDHSLRHGRWDSEAGGLVRDITALNPVRREIAVLGRWDYEHEHGADGHWAWQVRQTGKCRTEAYIPGEMYHYRYSSADSFTTARHPLLPGEIPPLPQYEWLTAL